MGDDVIESAAIVAEVAQVRLRQFDVGQSECVDVGAAVANLHGGKVDADETRPWQPGRHRYQVAA
jgi:hypothetical protein